MDMEDQKRTTEVKMQSNQETINALTEKVKKLEEEVHPPYNEVDCEGQRGIR